MYIYICIYYMIFKNRYSKYMKVVSIWRFLKIKFMNPDSDFTPLKWFGKFSIKIELLSAHA